jgi:hypothetical protein
VTQHHLSLTPAQQRQILTEGSIQIGALVLPSILKAGGRLFAQSRAPVAPATSPLPGSYINSRYTINMAGAPVGSATNAAGFARNGPWFWRQMLSQHPELFSEANAALIRRGRAPVVDATWVAGNPTHQSFLGDTLIHHHIDQGGIATALPQRVHRAWHSILHPD